MDENRRKTIIKEIEYWKTNHLLPIHYCDYLLALYTEGDVPEQSSKIRKKISPGFFLGSTPFLLLFTSLFVIYFTELSFILQIAFLFAVFLILFFLSYYYSRITLLKHFSFISAAIILLAGSVEITEHFFTQPEILYITVLFNCLLWIIAGKLKKLLYLTLSGLTGIGLLIFFILT